MRQQTVIYIHGAGVQEPGSASKLLLKEIKHELRGSFFFQAPLMPSPDNPDCQAWMDVLDALIHKSDGPVTLMGHSFGASVILKYLSESTVETEIASVLLLAAPFWGSNGWDMPDYHLEKANIGQLAQFDNIALFHCQDDEIVPHTHQHEYLNLIPYANGHFFESGGHFFKNRIERIIGQILQPGNVKISLNE